jgi:Mn2+/Fe2+ NRAMP family transporter
MEQPWMMVLHSIIIGLIIFLFMIFGLRQQNEFAQRTSILIASFALIYMLLFGHGLPKFK